MVEYSRAQQIANIQSTVAGYQLQQQGYTPSQSGWVSPEGQNIGTTQQAIESGKAQRINIQDQIKKEQEASYIVPKTTQQAQIGVKSAIENKAYIDYLQREAKYQNNIFDVSFGNKRFSVNFGQARQEELAGKASRTTPRAPSDLFSELPQARQSHFTVAGVPSKAFNKSPFTPPQTPIQAEAKAEKIINTAYPEGSYQARAEMEMKKGVNFVYSIYPAGLSEGVRQGVLKILPSSWLSERVANVAQGFIDSPPALASSLLQARAFTQIQAKEGRFNFLLPPSFNRARSSEQTIARMELSKQDVKTALISPEFWAESAITAGLIYGGGKVAGRTKGFFTPKEAIKYGETINIIEGVKEGKTITIKTTGALSDMTALSTKRVFGSGYPTKTIGTTEYTGRSFTNIISERTPSGFENLVSRAKQVIAGKEISPIKLAEPPKILASLEIGYTTKIMGDKIGLPVKTSEFGTLQGITGETTYSGRIFQKGKPPAKISGVAYSKEGLISSEIIDISRARNLIEGRTGFDSPSKQPVIIAKPKIEFGEIPNQPSLNVDYSFSITKIGKQKIAGTAWGSDLFQFPTGLGEASFSYFTSKSGVSPKLTSNIEGLSLNLYRPNMPKLSYSEIIRAFERGAMEEARSFQDMGQQKYHGTTPSNRPWAVALDGRQAPQIIKMLPEPSSFFPINKATPDFTSFLTKYVRVSPPQLPQPPSEFDFGNVGYAKTEIWASKRLENLGESPIVQKKKEVQGLIDLKPSEFDLGGTIEFPEGFKVRRKFSWDDIKDIKIKKVQGLPNVKPFSSRLIFTKTESGVDIWAKKDTGNIKKLPIIKLGGQIPRPPIDIFQMTKGGQIQIQKPKIDIFQTIKGGQIQIQKPKIDIFPTKNGKKLFKMTEPSSETKGQQNIFDRLKGNSKIRTFPKLATSDRLGINFFSSSRTKSGIGIMTGTKQKANTKEREAEKEKERQKQRNEVIPKITVDIGQKTTGIFSFGWNVPKRKIPDYPIIPPPTLRLSSRSRVLWLGDEASARRKGKGGKLTVASGKLIDALTIEMRRKGLF